MSVRLARPQGDSHDPDQAPARASDWYQERREAQGDAVDVYLPLFQGDVFSEVPLTSVPLTEMPQDTPPDGTEVLPDAVMLVGHPCSMVAGATPREYVEVVRVRPTHFLHYEKYDVERFAEFPLPFLDPATRDVHYSACLHERGLVRTADLDLRQRVAALDLDGVIALQQRITNETSRVRISDSLLRPQTQPRFQENQLARDWSFGVLGKLELTPEDLLAALATEAVEYDKALSTPLKAQDAHSGYVLTSTLREQMFDLRNESRVNVAVRKLIKNRAYAVKQERKRQATGGPAGQQAGGAAGDRGD